EREAAHKHALEKHQTDIDQQNLQKLSTLDREVRNHERAHAAVGGQYAGAPIYSFEKGPDGVNYAVSGEVPISTSSVSGDPQMTIEKAEIIRRAALAPAEPSAQDRKVAAVAVQMAAEAHTELLQMARDQRIEEQRLQEEQQMKNDNEQAQKRGENQFSASVDNARNNSEKNDPVDAINATQEQKFTEISNDLTAQLVALGGAQQAPQSLGSIVNRLA
ncbi:MAG: hypothetical protein ACI9D5_002503, partial [Candidatus Endobugula sp.]